MRSLILLLTLCLVSESHAQSIVLSRHSIVVSSSAPQAQVDNSEALKEQVEDLRRQVAELKRPAVSPVVAPVPAVPDHEVIIYTQPSCGPCVTMKNVDAPKLKARGVNFRFADITQSPVAWVRTTPSIEIRVKGRISKRWAGRATAEAILNELDFHSAPVIAQKSTAQASTTPRYRIFDGVPGSSHQNRHSLIDHLLKTGIHPSKGHTLQQLQTMSDQELDDLHTEDHREEGQVRTITQPAQQRKTVNWGGRQYSAPVCNNPRCAMCNAIRAGLQKANYPPQSALSPAQEPTPDAVLEEMIGLLDLDSDDVLADLGCGDGRVLIAAFEKYGCNGVGVEIDPQMAEKARQAVHAKGLEGRIQIVTGDAAEFSPRDYGVTAIAAYLFPEMLEKLSGIIAQAKIAVTPFHEVPGLAMTQHENVWVYRR